MKRDEYVALALALEEDHFPAPCEWIEPIKYEGAEGPVTRSTNNEAYQQLRHIDKELMK